MTELSERDKLIEELHTLLEDLPLYHKGILADFIIEKQKRIVSPLINNKDLAFGTVNTLSCVQEALKLAGLEKD